jgi:hypothetical protein
MIGQAPMEPGMPVPEIMIVAPPPILAPKDVIAHKCKGPQTCRADLSIELRKIAEVQSALFFDIATLTEASVVDGIHLDGDQHQI